MKHVLCVLVCLVPAAAWSGEFHSGAAQVKITPPIGVPMSGYYYERAATGTHDDLYAHALVFANDENRMAQVTCDLISLHGTGQRLQGHQRSRAPGSSPGR